MALIPIRNEPQNYTVVGQQAGQLVSQSWFECTVTIAKSTESRTIPVQTCTKVSELKGLLSVMMGYVEPGTFYLSIKRGCSVRKMLDDDQVLHFMTLNGRKSFTPDKYKYPYPYGIIGAGYLGLKTAMFFEKRGCKDYVMFDRYDRVGGHCWLEMANKTTKLQTEFPTYHVWYGPEFSNVDTTYCGGAPKDWEIWPTCDRILEHFQICAESFGILPQCKFNTDVRSMDIESDGRGFQVMQDRTRRYRLTCNPCDLQRNSAQGGGALKHQKDGDASLVKILDEQSQKKVKEMSEVVVSCLCQWPGALTFPRHVVYAGEEEFGGEIDYAVERRFDYSHIAGKTVTIHGHGAFTMENIRTCLESRIKKIYVLCRKMNLTCPRPVSWFINQADPPVPATQILNFLAHEYKLIGIDPWDLHAVHANASRTHASLIQKTRFGIGDVYFLSHMYGLMEFRIGNVKRCSYHTLHLDSGDKVECEAVLKCTGCLGDWKVDKLLKIKEMRGYWVNGDPRRMTTGEADGIQAASFATTTGGPGYYGMVKQMLHFWDCPADWERIENEGFLDALPVHRAGEPNEEFPAYFFTASHAQATGMLIGGICPILAWATQDDNSYKNWIQHHCVPVERIIADAKADWEEYEKKFREWGMVPKDTPYKPYFITQEYLEGQLEYHKANTKTWEERAAGT